MKLIGPVAYASVEKVSPAPSEPAKVSANISINILKVEEKVIRF